MTSFTEPVSTWGFTPAELDAVRAGVAELRRAQAEIARLEAEQVRTRARLMRIASRQVAEAESSEEFEFPIRSMAAEIACALRESPRTSRARLEEAAVLVERLPHVVDALEAGRIQAAHARVIVAEVGRFEPGDETLRARFEQRALEEATVKTPGQTGKAVRLLAEKLAPTSLQTRHLDAREGRGVWVRDLPDGMSELHAVLASPIAHGIHDRLTQLGHAAKREQRRAAREAARPAGAGVQAPDVTGDAGATETSNGLDAPTVDAPDVNGAPATRDAEATGRGWAASPTLPADTRTLDQLRADLLGDLLLTSEPSAHQVHAPGEDTLRAFSPRIQVTIPLDAIIDPLDWRSVAILDDATPIDTLTAWGLAGAAPSWERLFIHPDTGHLATTDTYRPTAAQRRHLEGRDVTCRFPGCGTPARRADIDHTVDWARGGPTSIDNLAHLCEPHHMLKHHSPWCVRQGPDGELEWTSPAGQTYANQPPSRVVFRAEHHEPDLTDASIGEHSAPPADAPF